MANILWDFVREFLPALTADEASQGMRRLRGRATGTTVQAAARKGSLTSAYYKLKPNIPLQKQQEIWNWIQNLEQTDWAAANRLEAEKNNDELVEMFQQGTPAEWRASIPKSLKERAETLLPTINTETAEQISQTFGGATRRRERRARAKKPFRIFLRFLFVLILGISIFLLFPDVFPFGREIIESLKRSVL